MDNFKRLSFTLLIASMTQIFAGGEDPVTEITSRAVQSSVNPTTVEPFIQEAFEAGKAAASKDINAHLEETQAKLQRFLNTYCPVLSVHKEEVTTRLKLALKSALELAFNVDDTNQGGPATDERDEVGAAIAILTSPDEDMATHEIRRLQTLLATRNDARQKLLCAYLQFIEAIDLGIAYRS